MSHLLISSHNPLLIKSIYGMLRDIGYSIDITDHPADAVRQVFNNKYDAVILDSRDVGLTASDASEIIGSISPDTRVVILGEAQDKTTATTFPNSDQLDDLKTYLSEVFDHNNRNHNKGGLYDTKRDYSKSL
ncbi:response regulator receiver domain protein [bacterium BMS3Bbin06]|nr:response regulator receiver domain protein [bacterium BMS3Abin08]GBE34280.1 response regulator receiver domain protein [bacterium BMS3Bbin06]HDY70859.1 response regulator [Nitrospirota bacterium]